MFCLLVENYAKDVTLTLQETMGQEAAAHVVDNMSLVMDLLLDETPPDEAATAIQGAIAETAN